MTETRVQLLSLHCQAMESMDSHNRPDDDYESLPTSDMRTHMIAGAMAGVMEHVIMYPLDSVKTRMQSLIPEPKAAYRSIPDALYKMVRYEGLFRPIRGVSAVISGAGPAHALYYSCYEKMKRVLSGSETGIHHPLAQGGAGCLATILHDAVMNPAEVVKQRMQMYNSPYRSVLQCFTDIWRREGFRAFYRSYVTSLSMNVPMQSMHFVAYEYMQDLTNNDRKYNPKAHMISGAIAGGVAAAATTPLDVCKTLLNTQEKQTLRTSKQLKITGMWNAASTIYQCCGPRGYFQGMQARVLATMPATAISWSIYELMKFVITTRNQIHLTPPHIASASHLPLKKSELVPSHTTVISKQSDIIPKEVY